jgi:hypothetical protein
MSAQASLQCFFSAAGTQLQAGWAHFAVAFTGSSSLVVFFDSGEDAAQGGLRSTSRKYVCFAENILPTRYEKHYIPQQYPLFHFDHSMKTSRGRTTKGRADLQLKQTIALLN